MRRSQGATGSADEVNPKGELRAMQLHAEKYRMRWISMAAVALVVLITGCAGEETTTEEAEPVAEAPAAAELEPSHGGRIVELNGDYDAELVVMEGGMTFVYLYDAEGNPVEYEGKMVNIKITTPDGQSQELELEGMGSGAGAHFMNPLEEAMVGHVLEQGAYTADITVETEAGTQTGTIEINLGG
jgi:hypothetical protein